jgi:hypothetical protein
MSSYYFLFGIATNIVNNRSEIAYNEQLTSFKSNSLLDR